MWYGAGMAELHLVHSELVFENEEENDSLRVEPRRSEKRTRDGVEHEFMFGASDNHGHNIQIGLRFPPRIEACTTFLVKHDDSPYKSDQDVWRDAMYHHLGRMTAWVRDPGFNELVDLARKQLRINQRMRVLEMRVETVNSAARLIRSLIEAKDWGELAEAIVDGQEVQAEATVDTRELDRAIDDGLLALETRR